MPPHNHTGPSGVEIRIDSLVHFGAHPELPIGGHQRLSVDGYAVTECSDGPVPLRCRHRID